VTLPGFFEGTGMPDAGWWEALWAKPAKVLTDVGIKPGMSAVDLCCGDGWFHIANGQACAACDCDRYRQRIARRREDAACGKRL